MVKPWIKPSFIASVCFHALLLSLLLWHSHTKSLMIHGAEHSISAHLVMAPIVKTVPLKIKKASREKVTIKPHKKQRLKIKSIQSQRAQHQGITGSTANALAQYVFDQIENHLTYPIQAQQLGMQGKVMTRFTISPSGRVSHIQLIHSSGFTLLDQAAINSIKKASPFLRAPHYIHNNYRITLPVLFQN